VNPSGKITETIPYRLEDVPSFVHFPGDTTGVRYGEGLFVGYRGYDALATEVAYPFGHGLSYTTFGYSDLSVSSTDNGLSVAVTVTNTGSRAGREIVQAYVSVPGSKVVRVPRELKGFADVTLEPGASAQVEIAIGGEDLAFWSVTDEAWLVEKGSYTVDVGSSSRDLRLQASVDVAGNEPRRPITLESSIKEALAVPGFAELLNAVATSFGGGGLAADEEMMQMMLDTPISALLGFAGLSGEQIQPQLDQVNAQL
jgi:beta-glucosidase